MVEITELTMIGLVNTNVMTVDQIIVATSEIKKKNLFFKKINAFSLILIKN